MPDKIWNIKSELDAADPAAVRLANSLSVSSLTARLLMSRGIDSYESAYRFFSFSDNVLHDPYLLADMDRAVERVERAIELGERITVYGDYDVDGVTSTALVWKYLKERGVSDDKLSYYIPGRSEEGYGVGRAAIDKLSCDGTDLVITVDTGVTAIDEIEYAKTCGIDFVITDHHECLQSLPNAVAVVDPERRDSENKYPFDKLAGVGVAFKLITALEISRLGREQDYLSGICKRYSDLVAIGTIADVMPVVDENRLFIKMGIKKMNDTPSDAVSMLVEEANRRVDGKVSRKGAINTSTVGFTLAPRINAAGRMAHASLALELFLTDSRSRAREIAAELCALNRRRQEEENVIVKEATEALARRGVPDRGVLVIAGDGWNNGVIGIVASRISEKYHLPTIIVSFDNDIGKGSGRSVEGINLVDALSKCSDLLEKFGGHELAAGLTVSRANYESFVERINEYVGSLLADGQNRSRLAACVNVECEISPPEVTLAQAKELELFEPFGSGNPVPLFLMRRVKIVEINELALKHTKLTVRKGTFSFTLLMFGSKRENLDLLVDDEIDIVFELSVNEFRGISSVQLICRDHKLSNGGISDDERQEYRRIRSGGSFSKNDPILPGRADFASVYTCMKRCVGRYISNREFIASDIGISYAKVRIIIEVLIERGLISVASGSPDNDIAIYTVNKVEKKAELECSPIYIKVAGNMIE